MQKLQNTTNAVIHSGNFLPSGLHRRINNSDADIVHLHWLGAEIISVKELAKIKKPVVWTLHDMWAFCGSEHYDDLQSPERYKAGYLRSNRPRKHSGIDIDRWTWVKKRKHWSNKNFFIVTPSTWLANCAKESELLKDKNNIRVIPNGLDMTVYQPKTKKWSRKKLNIQDDDNTRYLLFGAISATSDQRKGYMELKSTLNKLADNDSEKRYHLIVFGSDEPVDSDWGMPSTFLGTLSDDETLTQVYSAADVMIVPSLQDNLPNTAVESIACGTPVVAFNVGGLPDIVDHGINGYLTVPYDNNELAYGIEWVLQDDARLNKLSENARKKAVESFSIDVVAGQYQELYKEVIRQK